LVYDLADNVGGGGATNSGGGEDNIMSDLCNNDQPLDAEVNPSSVDYRRIEERIGAGKPDGGVSAFNSSI
jgi:hypothetical protein